MKEQKRPIVGIVTFRFQSWQDLKIETSIGNDETKRTLNSDFPDDEIRRFKNGRGRVSVTSIFATKKRRMSKERVTVDLWLDADRGVPCELNLGI